MVPIFSVAPPYSVGTAVPAPNPGAAGAVPAPAPPLRPPGASARKSPGLAGRLPPEIMALIHEQLMDSAAPVGLQAATGSPAEADHVTGIERARAKARAGFAGVSRHYRATDIASLARARHAATSCQVAQQAVQYMDRHYDKATFQRSVEGLLTSLTHLEIDFSALKQENASVVLACLTRSKAPLSTLRMTIDLGKSTAQLATVLSQAADTLRRRDDARPARIEFWATGDRRCRQPPDLRNIPNVTHLDMRDCSITSAPNLAAAPHLETLLLSRCRRLRGALDWSQNTCLTTLKLDGAVDLLPTAPDFTGNPGLQIIDISGAGRWHEAPDFSRNPALRQLSMRNWHALTKPPVLGGNAQLTVLDLSGCVAMTEPPDVSGNGLLRVLDLSDCSRITKPPDVSRNEHLSTLRLDSCSALDSAPDLSNIGNLRIFAAFNCVGIRTPPAFERHVQLQRVTMSNWSSLAAAPCFVHNRALEVLDLSNCTQMRGVLDFSHHSYLQEVILAGCHALTDTPLFLSTAQLDNIDLSDCPGLLTPPVLTAQASRVSVDLYGCPGLAGSLGPLRALLGGRLIA